VLKQALLRRFDRRTTGQGEIEFPCIPSMLDPYMAKLESLWKVIGKPFSEAELAQLRKAVETELVRGYQASVYSRLTVRFETHRPPHPGIQYVIVARVLPLEDVFTQWGAAQNVPLFGRLSDTKVTALAADLGDPKSAPVLDIGAGVGRNAIPLARLGHPTDAIEPVATMADAMRGVAAAESIPLEVIQADVLKPDVALKSAHYKLVIVAEVTSHFRDADDMRRLFTKLADALVPGGLALVTIFLASDGYKPDDLAREAAQAMWSTMYTRAELAFITQELPFDKISDESMHDYEKEHLPPEAWPPTVWFEAWSQANDVFALPPGKTPVDLRWVVYRKR
jgi:SAM-dependent methyltransferase